jgi:hypothetical protein
VCSYTANLKRIGEALLNTDAAYVERARANEKQQREMAQMILGGSLDVDEEQQLRNERRLADVSVPQYPLIWSASVLAGLLGISLWILSFRVKSLDRLR